MAAASAAGTQHQVQRQHSLSARRNSRPDADESCLDVSSISRVKKLIILLKKHKIVNKNIKIVNLGILKVKTWFGDKDL